MNIVDPQVPPVLVPAGSIPKIINGPHQEYLDLPCVITPNNYLITRWEPTRDERAAILRGEDVYITLIVSVSEPIRLNPMIVTVGPVDWTQEPV